MKMELESLQMITLLCKTITERGASQEPLSNVFRVTFLQPPDYLTNRREEAVFYVLHHQKGGLSLPVPPLLLSKLMQLIFLVRVGRDIHLVRAANKRVS